MQIVSVSAVDGEMAEQERPESEAGAEGQTVVVVAGLLGGAVEGEQRSGGCDARKSYLKRSSTEEGEVSGCTMDTPH